MGDDSRSTFGRRKRFENSPQQDKKGVLLLRSEFSDGVLLEGAPCGVHGTFQRPARLGQSHENSATIHVGSVTCDHPRFFHAGKHLGCRWRLDGELASQFRHGNNAIGLA